MTSENESKALLTAETEYIKLPDELPLSQTADISILINTNCQRNFDHSREPVTELKTQHVLILRM